MNRTSLAGTGLGVLSAITFLTFSLSSCHKEEDPITPVNPTPTSTAYSFPITDGSYWVYQQEQTDSDGVITQAGATDSVYVEGDTIIGANTYKKIRTFTSPGNTYFLAQPLTLVRDSAGYLVDVNGQFIEHDNFTDTLRYVDYGGIVDGWYFMRHKDSTVTVPAGTFTTIDYEGHMYNTQPGYPWPIPRYTHQIFADNIGKITEVQYFVSQPGYIQRRLLSYHIQ
jgi:hypothetical protein